MPGVLFCPFPNTLKTLFQASSFLSGSPVAGLQFHIQLSVCTSGHHVHKSLFSFFRGIILLTVDFPTVKRFIHLCIRRDFHVMQVLHIVLNVKGVFLVIIGQLLVSAMLRYIEFIREEWSDTSKLHDTFPAVHDRNLILAHQFYATLSSDEFNFAHKKSRDTLESLLLKYYFRLYYICDLI